MSLNNLFWGLICVILFLNAQILSEQRALNVEDLFKCQRLSEINLSPNGEWIAFTLQTINLDKNSSQKKIFLISNDGEEIVQFTKTEKDSWSPQWSPEGDKLAFLSNCNGTPQIFIQELNSSEAKQITNIYCGVNSFIWSPSGKKMAFVARVYPEMKNFDEMEIKDKEKEANPVKAKVYDRLLFRHWDTWWDGKRNHIFVLDLESNEIKDVTPGDYDAPPIALGSGYVFSPDERYLVFTSNHDPEVAISTNNDIWRVNLSNGKLELITKPIKGRDFKGNDHSPLYSPDGKYLAFLSMARTGFEADKNDLILWDESRKDFINLTKELDIRIDAYTWHPDSKHILLQIDERGREVIKILDIETRDLKPLVSEGYNTSPSVSRDGKYFAYFHQSSTRPAEIWLYKFEKRTPTQLTHFNDSLFQDIVMNEVEDIEYLSKDKRKIHGFIIKPPFFDPDKKYPAVFMIHGGPQGAWHDSWHYRWNLQLWAAQGYVIVAINPRGSTGYGQKFTDEISRDWGGKVFQDLVAGQKYVVENFPFIDKDKLAAAGASYGGYMINFIQGNMAAFKYPFKTLICHDGSFNLYSKMLTTEELWFPEWELGGPFWENPKIYEKFSPHKFIKNFKTPMLIIHGEKDYRLDPSEGIQAFTALRRLGIPAKLVLFPDEGHWVLKPQNSLFWHKVVFDWLAQYLK